MTVPHIRLSRAEAIAVVAASLLAVNYTGPSVMIDEDGTVEDAAALLDAAQRHVKEEHERKES